MTTRLINKIVSFLFVGLLFTPFVALLSTEQSDISSVEKRRLAKLPQLEFSSELIKSYPKKFAAFFEDHFGFRNQIVGLHNYLYCRFFGISPSKIVIAGKEGWYFLNADGAVSDYLGKVHYDEITLMQIESLLQDRKKWLNHLGVKYLFLPVPNKEMIYGEFLPDVLARNKGKCKYDQIIGFLEENSEFDDYIDAQRLMLAHKDEGALYFKTDSHWNAIGVLIFCRELVKRLQQWFPEMEPLPEVGKKKWKKGGSGDLAVLMNLHNKITEPVPESPVVLTCKPKFERKMKEIRSNKEYSTIPNHRLPLETGCETARRKAIVFHDSFGNGLKPYLTHFFKEVIYIHYMNFEVAKAFVEKEKPDVVLDLRVARNIQKALVPDSDLEQFVLKSTFKNLQEDISISSSSVQKGVSLSSPPTSGNKEVDRKKIAIKVDIFSDKSIDVIGCYQSGKDVLYRKQCQKRALVSGENELFFRFFSFGGRGDFSLKAEKRDQGYAIRKVTAKKEA